jgi:hypothetical protein
MKSTNYDREFDLGMDFIVAGLEQLLATSGSTREDDNRGYDKVIG